MILDPRYTQLASGLTGFSTGLKKGERVLIDAFDVPDAMVIALIRATRERGAYPYVQIHRARVTQSAELIAQAVCWCLPVTQLSDPGLARTARQPRVLPHHRCSA